MIDSPESELKILGPKIYWAFGTKDGQRGSTWRFWSTKKGHFYLSVRSLGGEVKWSYHPKTMLHPDVCNIGPTREYRKKVPKAPPTLDRWELPEGKKALALSIVTSAEDMDVFESEEAEPMIWLPAPKPGFVAGVTIAVWPTGAAGGFFEFSSGSWVTRVAESGERWPGEFHGTLPIGGILKTESRSAIAVYAERNYRSDMREIIEQDRASARENAPPGFTPGPDVRAIFIRNLAGQRLLTELRLRA